MLPGNLVAHVPAVAGTSRRAGRPLGEVFRRIRLLSVPAFPGLSRLLRDKSVTRVLSVCRWGLSPDPHLQPIKTKKPCIYKVFMVAPTGFEPNNRGSGQSRISLKTVMLSGISACRNTYRYCLFPPVSVLSVRK